MKREWNKEHYHSQQLNMEWMQLRTFGTDRSSRNGRHGGWMSWNGFFWLGTHRTVSKHNTVVPLFDQVRFHSCLLCLQWSIPWHWQNASRQGYVRRLHGQHAQSCYRDPKHLPHSIWAQLTSFSLKKLSYISNRFNRCPSLRITFVDLAPGGA